MADHDSDITSLVTDAIGAKEALQRSANKFAGAINDNAARVMLAIKRKQLYKLHPPGDDRSAGEFKIAARDQSLEQSAAKTEAQANHIDSWSKWFGLAAWLCLVAAFATLATGLVVTLGQMAHR